MEDALSPDLKTLLASGEQAHRLPLSGWIVLGQHLHEGDDILIEPCDLFDHPVRATVRGINSLNNVAIHLHTAGARDAHGALWHTGPQFGWMNILFHIWRIRRDAN